MNKQFKAALAVLFLTIGILLIIGLQGLRVEILNDEVDILKEQLNISEQKINNLTERLNIYQKTQANDGIRQDELIHYLIEKTK